MLATITGTGDGSAPVVDLTFPFIDTDHVKASVDGASVAFTFTGASQITFSTAVPAGSIWKVYRATPTSPAVVDFTNGAVLTEADLDLAETSSRYRDEELQDLTSAQQVQVDTNTSGLAAETAARAAADAALEVDIKAIPKGDPGSSGEGFSSRAALVAHAATNFDDAYLTETGREGKFIATTADMSANIAADPQQGVYIPGSGVTWVRELNGLRVTPRHFGAVGDGLADDTAALQAFWDLVIAEDLPHDASGSFAISSTLTIGPAAAPAEIPALPLYGRMRIVALAPMNEMVHLKNLAYRRWYGGLDLTGLGGASFSSRTCLIGAFFENCARLEISGGVIGNNFALANVYMGLPNNNMMKFGGIRGSNIGSGQVGNSLTANWSNPVNSGSSNSTGQRTTVDLDAFPSAAIQSYEPIGSYPVQLRIGGYLYYVFGIDEVANTATIYPWIDPAAGTSGVAEWVFGGNFCTRSSDSNLIEVERLDASSVGRNLSEGAEYGSIIRDMQTNGAGTVIQVGMDTSAVAMGPWVQNRYVEAGTVSEHFVSVTQYGTSTSQYLLGEAGEIDLSKYWNLGARRITGGALAGSTLGTDIAAGGGTALVGYRGRPLYRTKNDLTAGPGSTHVLTGQAALPFPEVYYLNSHNLTLSVQGAGEYNRLFGFTGGIIGYVGTGVNGAPTGSFVFTPPAGGTINGGAVGATATFSGFDGPVFFVYEMIDTTQLNWKVYPVAGQFHHKAAASSATYVAPSGGTTIDTEGRASLAQLASDLADLKAKLVAAGLSS